MSAASFDIPQSAKSKKTKKWRRPDQVLCAVARAAVGRRSDERARVDSERGFYRMDLASTALTDLASLGRRWEQAKDWMKFAND